jgi:hypothetical protein
MEDIKEVMKAGVSILMDTILNLLQKDPHGWSERGCSTCQAISSISGRPFGCSLYRLQRETQRKREAEKDKNNV